MIWDKTQNQINNRMYQQSVEEYERRQKQLEKQRKQQQNGGGDEDRVMSLPNANREAISVAGEPLMSADLRGNMIFNKMKKIDEDFDEIGFEVNFKNEFFKNYQEVKCDT